MASGLEHPRWQSSQAGRPGTVGSWGSRAGGITQWVSQDGLGRWCLNHLTKGS